MCWFSLFILDAAPTVYTANGMNLNFAPLAQPFAFLAVKKELTAKYAKGCAKGAKKETRSQSP